MKRSLVLLLYVLVFTLSPLRGEKLVLPEGQKHMIHCTATDSRFIINWVDDDGTIGEKFQVGDEETQNDGKRIRSISFNATAEVNNTNLRCLITDVTQIPPHSSTRINTTIFIQGTLPLLDVNSIRINNGVQFTWSPPFSLDITDIEPDISYYQIDIINMLDNSVTTNTTYDTQFILESSSECQLHIFYQVKIAVVNVVGVGEKYISPPITIDELCIPDDLTVSLCFDNPEIKLQVNTSCIVLKLTFTFIPISSSLNPSLTINHVIGKGETKLTLSSSDIAFDEHYQMIVTVEELSNNYSTILNLSTYDVQRVEILREIQHKSNEHEFKCYFAHGSRARGCMIVLRYEINGECVLNATRSERDREAVVTATLANGHYTVMVYDIEEEENEEGNPADITTLLVVNSIDTTASVCVIQSPNIRSKEEFNPNCSNNAIDVYGSDHSTNAIVIIVSIPLAVTFLLFTISVIIILGIIKIRSTKKVKGKNKFNMHQNPVYIAQQQPHTPREEMESSFDMDNNPVYSIITT